MIYKTICQGRLDFGSPKSFENVVKMYYWREENFYKMDVFVDSEEILDEENHCIAIPRLITQSSKKTFSNTLSLLDYIGEYAVGGSIEMWLIQDGKIIERGFVVPNNTDRMSVRKYSEGCSILEKAEDPAKAEKAFTKVIDKYPSHAHAYERRAFVKVLLNNYEEALNDYNKSIQVDPDYSKAYLGRAFVHNKLNNSEAALADYDIAIKKSIPLQPHYWKARHYKGLYLMGLEKYEAAIKEFTFFVRRRFENDNPNYLKRRSAYFKLGKCHLKLQQFSEALTAFDTALSITENKDNIEEMDLLVYRGMALQKLGDSDYKTVWSEAQDLGSVRATELLAEHCE